MDTAAIERSTMRKAYIRLVPYCFVLYILCYIDRINVSFAALTMNKRSGPDRVYLRSRGRRLLLGLLPAGGAIQHHPGTRRRAALDRAHHDHLGPLLRRHRVRHRSLELLRHPRPARHRRGRAVSRPDAVFPPLVPAAPSRPRGRLVPDRVCRWRPRSAVRCRPLCCNWTASGACTAGNGCSSARACRPC